METSAASGMWVKPRQAHALRGCCWQLKEMHSCGSGALVHAGRAGLRPRATWPEAVGSTHTQGLSELPRLAKARLGSPAS